MYVEKERVGRLVCLKKVKAITAQSPRPREKLQILHLDDNLVDSELCLATLVSGGLDCDVFRVDSEAEFIGSLKKRKVDIIISDYSLPAFDGKSALAYASKHHPDIPFIFVSGIIGEDAAIDSLVNGATDYVLKHRFSRLLPAVQRAVRESTEREKRRRAELAVRESEEKYRRVFEESKDAIFIRTLQGRFVDINPAGIEMLGYASKDDFVSIDLTATLYQDPVKLARLRKTIEQQGYVRDFEVSLKKKDGSVRIVIETTTAVRNEDGAIVACHGIWHDVTEQRKLEAQFLRAQRLENIGKLASGIAHDLNNILAPILMGIELLRQRLPDPKDAAMLDILQKSSQRGADMVRQILEFARGIASQRGIIQLRHLLHDIEKIMQQTLSKAIQVTANAPRHLWDVVADSTQMHQVLVNLCINARDAMPGGGTLTITARNVMLGETLKRWGLEIGPGPYIALDVSDTGTGIPAEILDKIFEPFFTTKELGKGTGLGLSTVRDILRAHGGLVDIDSVEGRGTVVTAYVPAEAAQRDIIEQEREPTVAGNGELILVVDDEAAIRNISRATLEAFGYRVMTASDGVEALALFAQHKREIRVVLSDVNMPILDGPALVQALERMDSDVRIICASGSTPGIGGSPPTRGGVVRAHLEKPFTADELLKTLWAVIHLPRTED